MKIKRIDSRVITGITFTALLILSGCTITDVTSSTSGTLDTVTPDVTLNRFVDVRLASIQKEAAKGEGENLNALAELMGKNDKQAFSLWVHKNYDELFSNLEQPSQLISRIEIRGNDLI
ncbi:MAG: DUF3015 family protein [Gammaproteobacteria bacterium]|nr:DUF3015 family protein [Gammaproteobacteria bacterium]